MGDPFIIEMAALLHDIPDEKLNESEEAGRNKLDSFFQTISLPEEEKTRLHKSSNRFHIKAEEKQSWKALRRKSFRMLTD